MVIRSNATFDPARRTHAPNMLWGVFTRTEGAQPYGYAEFEGVGYGEMEPHAGICARQRDPNSPQNNCGHWLERISGLPPRARGCEQGCSITPSGARFDPDARWLTLTLHVERYNTQYSASFSSLADYIQNALCERGLTTEALFMELGHIEAALQPHIGALVGFTRTPQNLYDATHHYLETHPNLLRAAQADVSLGAGASR